MRKAENDDEFEIRGKVASVANKIFFCSVLVLFVEKSGMTAGVDGDFCGVVRMTFRG
jgi:hypothetical protein